VRSSYGRALALPGALRFSLSGLVARMPMSMVSLGIVLLVSTRTGSYARAGGVSAAFLVANAVFATPQARLIDRLGQGRVLSAGASAFGLALVALMTCVELDVSPPWPHLAAALAGATLPQVGSSVRARWSYLVDDKQDLHTAYSFESVVDELVFIVGPALVTSLATVVHPLAGLLCAAVAAVAGTMALVSQKATEPPAVGRDRHRSDQALPWRALAPLVLCAFALGALLSAAEVVTVAYSDELGTRALSGPMLAIWAMGSLISGLVVGAVRPKAANRTMFAAGMTVLAVSMVPLPFVDGFPSLGICLFLAGFAISPTLIAAFAWIEEEAPAGRLTEAITIFTTGLAAGLAPGAALAGTVIERSGASTGYWVPVGAGLLGASLALATCACRASTSPAAAADPHVIGTSAGVPPAASPGRRSEDSVAP
jgi:MFS family permease